MSWRRRCLRTRWGREWEWGVEGGGLETGYVDGNGGLWVRLVWSGLWVGLVWFGLAWFSSVQFLHRTIEHSPSVRVRATDTLFATYIHYFLLSSSSGRYAMLCYAMLCYSNGHLPYLYLTLCIMSVCVPYLPYILFIPLSIPLSIYLSIYLSYPP